MEGVGGASAPVRFGPSEALGIQNYPLTFPRHVGPESRGLETHKVLVTFSQL